MKIYRLPQLADSSPDGTFCLSPGNRESDALYLVYTKVRPGEAQRKLNSSGSAEEIVFVLKGKIRVKCGKSTFSVGAGEAFHCNEPCSILIDNPEKDEAVIITAGSAAAKQAVKTEQAPEPSLEAADQAKEEPEFVITTDDSPEDGEAEGEDAERA